MVKHDYSKLTPCDLFNVIRQETESGNHLTSILCRAEEKTEKQKIDNITLRKAIRRREDRISKAYHYIFCLARETVLQRKTVFKNMNALRAEDQRNRKMQEQRTYSDMVAQRLRTRAELFLETCRAHLSKEQVAAIWDKAEQENPDHPAFAHLSKKIVADSLAAEKAA